MPSVRDLYRKQTTELANASLEPLALPHIATPSDPGAGNTAVYAKSDGKIYTFPAGGAETEVGSGSGGGREVLTADRTYYVRTDGNDSNDGLSNSAGGAFLTWQKAADVLGSLDISIYNVTLKAGSSGTWVTGFIVKAPVGSGQIIIEGDTTTPANVFIDTSGFCILAEYIPQQLTIRGFKLRCSDLQSLRIAAGFTIISDIYFLGSETGTAGLHVGLQIRYGARVIPSGVFWFEGKFSYCIMASDSASYSAWEQIHTYNLVAGVNFNMFFFVARWAGVFIRSSFATFVGTGSGARVSASVYGMVDSAGMTLPGTGSTLSSGGIYT